MELSNGSGFSSLQVLQIETPHQVIIAPYMLTHQVYLTHENGQLFSKQIICEFFFCFSFTSYIYLVYVIEFGSFFRPVTMTQNNVVLHQSGQHDDYHTALLPHHLPEIRRRLRQRSLCCNVCRVTWIVVGLRNVTI